MTNKKGAVSTSTIIYLAIGVFVLALVILWITGLGGKIITDLWGDPIDEAKTECRTLCASAKIDLSTWKASSYCSKQIDIGDIDGDGNNDFANCWADPISIRCGDKSFVTGKNYTVYYVDEGGCTSVSEIATAEEANSLIDHGY